MKRILLLLTSILALALILVGCGSEKAADAGKQNKEIRVGVTAGPHEEVMEFVASEAKKQGLNVKLVTFNDYVQPNIALSQKEIEVNSFQHQPYLDNMIKDRGLKIVSLGKTILAPMGIYSDKIKDIKDVPNGATVAIPNDPTNGGRALLVLQQEGLLKLKDGIGSGASVSDIVSNPKNLKIKELDAAQIPRSLKDVDFAAINTNYALNAGLNPVKDSIAIERKDSEYSNVIAVREEDKDNPQYKKILEVYQSEPVRKFIEEKFQGSIIPAF